MKRSQHVIADFFYIILMLFVAIDIKQVSFLYVCATGMRNKSITKRRRQRQTIGVRCLTHIDKE